MVAATEDVESELLPLLLRLKKAAYCQSNPFLSFLTNFPLVRPALMLSPLDFTGWAANQEITPFCTDIIGIWEGHKNEYETNTNMHHRALNKNAWHTHASRTYALTTEYLFL